MSHVGPRVDVWIGLVVAALGAGLWMGAADIPFGAGYDRIGPRVFPHLVAGGLMLFGLLLVPIRRGQRGPAPAAGTLHGDGPVNWVPLAYLALALTCCLLLLDVAGFIAASSLQFWLTARAFHSRRPGRDALCSIVFSLLVYLAFSRGLDMNLPGGPLEGVL